MKGFRIAVWLALGLLCAVPARAQAPPEMPKADLFGSLGWLNGHKPDLAPYNDWYNRSLLSSATVGWYWTEHLKSEVEVAASTPADLYANREVTIDGRRTFASSEYTFSTRRITLSQQYQFGRNAWFHPHLAAGLDLAWERVRQTDEEIYLYDSRLQQSRIVRRPPADPDRTDFRSRPFAAAGFKAYMTPRAFFRTDLRFVAGSRLDDVLLRFGFGVDF
jgi:hypothetical protein